MIYTLKEYSQIKNVSTETIRKRIKAGTLPSTHKIKKLSGKHGAYIIEIPDK